MDTVSTKSEKERDNEREIAEQWNALSPFKKFRERARFGASLLEDLRAKNDYDASSKQVRVALSDITVFKKIEDDIKKGKSVDKALRHARQIVSERNQLKKVKRVEQRAQKPTIHGRARISSYESSGARVALSSFLEQELHYDGLLIWESTFQAAAKQFSEPPAVKGGVFFQNFLVPVISQTAVDKTGAARLVLHAVDDLKDLRIIATGSLVGNNDILRFTLVHRALTVDCAIMGPGPQSALGEVAFKLLTGCQQLTETLTYDPIYRHLRTTQV